MIFSPALRTVSLLLLGLALAACNDTATTGPDASSNPPGTLHVTSYQPLNHYGLALTTGTATNLFHASDAFMMLGGSYVAISPTNDLVELSADGRQSRTILAHDLNNTETHDDAFGFPQVSPDGTMIAYEGFPSTSKVYVVRRQDGEPLAVLEGNDNRTGFFHPTWTPDNRLLVTGALDNPGLYLSDAALTEINRIDPDLARPDYPAVSPDGQHVAFILNSHLYTMKIDGSDVRQITTSSTDETWPAWSPDSKWIAIYGADANLHRTIFLVPIGATGTPIDVSAISSELRTYLTASGNFQHPMYWR